MMSRSSIALSVAVALGGCLLATPAFSQRYPVTPEQTTKAQQVAQAGVALNDLAPNAPDSYTIKRGDTLWAISSLFLKSPWRWPELWGMNLQEIRNPHLIYPGQLLVLDKSSGRAILRTSSTGTPVQAPGASAAPVAKGGDDDDIATVRLSPRTRSENYGGPLTALSISSIEHFLSEPLIVEESEMAAAPRIVALAAQDSRVMITRGDRVYARGPANAPLLDNKGRTQLLRVFGNATPLKDPDTAEVLGFEAQFVGKAALMRSETTDEAVSADGKTTSTKVPATIDIVEATNEILIGYRLLPEPARQFPNYVPHAPTRPMAGRIISVYGSTALVNASQNQIVVINLGRRNGLENGHVLAILKNGARVIDKTDSDRTLIKLPNERNGLLMVFRTFEKLSYGLILEITEGVRVGDRLASPQ